jgi:putative membrane protein
VAAAAAETDIPPVTPQDRDPRIYFAAERTFLAWIRTGLALMGFGFVVARFGLFLKELGAASSSVPVKSSGFSLATGTALVLVGVIVNAVAALQHVKTVHDLNAGRDVTGRPSVAGISVAVLLAAVGLAMSAYLLIFR